MKKIPYYNKAGFFNGFNSDLDPARAVYHSKNMDVKNVVRTGDDLNPRYFVGGLEFKREELFITGSWDKTPVIAKGRGGGFARRPRLFLWKGAYFRKCIVKKDYVCMITGSKIVPGSTAYRTEDSRKAVSTKRLSVIPKDAVMV